MILISVFFNNETDSRHLKQIMNAAKYSQIVEGAKFVSSGSLLDHVYVKQSLLDNFQGIKCEVKSVITLTITVYKSVCLKNKEIS